MLPMVKMEMFAFPNNNPLCKVYIDNDERRINMPTSTTMLYLTCLLFLFEGWNHMCYCCGSIVIHTLMGHSFLVESGSYIKIRDREMVIK